jgi:hypothetical protein
LRLLQASPQPDYAAITQIWMQTDDHEAATKALIDLLTGTNYPEAYQIAFDLNDMAGGHFADRVVASLADRGYGWDSAPVSDII